ncbi:MAG: sulfite exporter TauE/SafE family protein [Paracoccaceae bacterium]
MSGALGSLDLWPSLASLVLVTLAAALARGFSGFGAALIFIPPASAILGPHVAVPLLLVADGIVTSVMIPGAARTADRRDVLTMALGAVAGVPAGVCLLRTLDPVTIRWGIVAIAAVMLALLASGWRYRGRPRAALTVGVGALSGVFSGAAQIGGPPVVAYWLGGNTPAPIMRANIFLFFAVTSLFSAAGYVWSGLITTHVLALTAVIAPVYGIGAWLGSRMFGLASERTFRRICLAMILAATVVSLPALDSWLRGG